MPREIRTTIAVDGEAAFKKAINEANTSLKNMGTQLSLASAEFRKDGDAMKLMESRSKTLRAEVGQQENIVKALEKAVEDSTKAYGENSAKTEKWQAELNRAKARLANLQSELTLNEQGLDRNGKAFDDSAQKAADYSATLKNIGKGVSFDNVTSGLDKITGGLEGAITKVANFALSLRDAMVDAGKWADDLVTDATKYGMDVEELQRWQGASRYIDTSVEAIVGARDKLAKKMMGGWNDGGLDMWKVLGIDIQDENGFRDQMDVMWELGETLMSMERIDGNDVRADQYAMEVFGKSWRELRPLFVAGRQEWEKAVAEQHVVSAEHVKSLSEMDDANQHLEASFETLKMTTFAELAPTLTEITNALSGLLDEFLEWMDTEEGKQAMASLSDAIAELFSGLKDVKFSDAIDAVKNAINSVKEALNWIATNRDKIKVALEIIGGGFAAMKLATVAANIAKVVEGFKTLWGGASKPLPSAPSVPTTGTGATGSGVTTAGKAAVTAAGAASGSMEVGLGGALGGVGSLSLIGAAGGTALIVVGAAVLGAVVNRVNEEAQRQREVDIDSHRFENFGQGEGQNYEFYGLDKRGVIQNSVRALLATSGGSEGIMGPESQMRFLAHNLGEDILEAFQYEGGTKNKLIDMLGMDDQNAAVAAMMLHAAGYSTNDSRLTAEQQALYSDAYGRYEEMRRNGSLGYTYGLTTMRDFFLKSGRIDENGLWTIDGAEIPTNSAMPVINGVPLANMSGYVMTRRSETPQYVGTWDPSMRQAAPDLASVLQSTLFNSGAGPVSRGFAGMILGADGSADMRRFNNLPGEMQNGVQTGIRNGMSGMRIEMDGESVARVVSPYVNRELGRWMQ